MFIGYIIGWVRFPTPGPVSHQRLDNSRFEVLLAKIFSLKQ